MQLMFCRIFLWIPCLLLCCVLFQQAAIAQEPISIKSTELLRRYIEPLAAKANVAPPPSTILTHAELGQYFLQLLPKLAELPPGALSDQDLQDVGMLSQEFERSLMQVRGAMLLKSYKTSTPEFDKVQTQVEDAKSRLAILEKVKVNGDFIYAPIADMGRGDRDSISANLRGRLNFLAKVNEAKDGSRLGDGYAFLRLTAAAGRFFPRNKFLLGPLNDINDANASPFNSGPNEVQVSNLVINNNNSNSLRPTVSMEQAYYSQDIRPGGKFKANFKSGLIANSAFFDSNNFANNEALQFMNTQFVNSISWRPNFNGPATIVSVEHPLFRQKAFLRYTGGISTISNRDYFGCYGFNHELQFGHIFKQKEGNFRVGFWNWNFRKGTPTPFTTPVDVASGTGLLAVIPGGLASNGPRPVGMYLNFDQRVWKNIGLWGRYAVNDKNIGEVFLGGLLSSRGSFSFGAEIPVGEFYKRRPDDVIGIAYGQIQPYSREVVSPATPAFLSLNGVPATTLAEVNNNLSIMNPGPHHRNEKAMEIYYRYQINKNISISPDVQTIWSPGGTGPQPVIFTIGSRLNVVF